MLIIIAVVEEIHGEVDCGVVVIFVDSLTAAGHVVVVLVELVIDFAICSMNFLNYG
jgi:kynureninase